MGLKTFPYFEHRKNRGVVSKRWRDPLLHGVGRLHHVGVRRNQHLESCIISIASHKVFSSFGGMLCVSKDRFQTRPPRSIGRSTITDLNGSTGALRTEFRVQGSEFRVNAKPET